MRAMEGEVQQWLRLLSQGGRAGPTASATPSDASADAATADTVGKLLRVCESGRGQSLDVLSRALPALARIFQRAISLPQPTPSSTLLLLAVLRFYLHFGDEVLHDADKSLHTLFRSCLGRQYADPTVATAVLNFAVEEKAKLLAGHPQLLPQYFPLILKMLLCCGPKVGSQVEEILPAMVAPTSLLPLFPSLLDLPVLALALDDLEGTAGTLPGAAPSGALKRPAPEDLFALMDAAYTGSATSGSNEAAEEDQDQLSSGREALRGLFKEQLRDENDGLAEGVWATPGLAVALAAATGSQASARVSHALQAAPRLLHLYFAVALRDVSDEELGALLPVLFERMEHLFPQQPAFSSAVRRLCMQFVLLALERSPHLIATLQKPIVNVIGQPSPSSVKAELALQLCWAVGEHGGGGFSHVGAARQLYECLELVLYESLAASAAAAREEDSARDALGSMEGPPRQSARGGHARARLLCVVVAAVAKLATWHRTLNPRARICIAKVARSQHVVDKSVWQRACVHLALLRDPAICAAVLGPTGPGHGESASSTPRPLSFYLLADQPGLPLHDFSLADQRSDFNDEIRL